MGGLERQVHLSQGSALVLSEMTMKIAASKIAVASPSKAGTVLFVVDFVTGNPGILDFACKFAEWQNASLQLLQVIDLDHTHSSPDAQMGAQFNLEMHAQRARALKRSAMSLLSFGSPETEIPRRAAEVNASFVVLPLNLVAAYPFQKRLVEQLRTKCDCPVLALPADLFVDAHAESLTISRLPSMIRRVREADRRSTRGLRALVKSRSQVPAPIITNPAHLLRRQRA